MTERDFAIDVVHTLQDAGHQAVFAGGCVRDQLLGLTPTDYDVASSATPEQVQQLFRRTIAIGASFGVIEVLGPKVDSVWRKVQVATFRRDGDYHDGRRPESVTFTSAEEDARRRDFTINGLFYDPVRDELLDYVGGKADLQSKILRAIGDPHERFSEDKLRLLRAVRMATRFNLAIDSATIAAARVMAPQISVVSVERIADELCKLFSHPNRVRGLELLRDFQLVSPILPELETNFDQNVHAVSQLPSNSEFITVFATLLREESVVVARRLKLSNQETQCLAWMNQQRPLLHEPLVPSRIYPILADDRARLLLQFCLAVTSADGDSARAVRKCQMLKQSLSHFVLNPPPLLTGNDLVKQGWQPGPEFKLVLERVRAAQLDSLVTTPREAFELAKSLRRSII